MFTIFPIGRYDGKQTKIWNLETLYYSTYHIMFYKEHHIFHKSHRNIVWLPLSHMFCDWNRHKHPSLDPRVFLWLQEDYVDLFRLL